MTRDPLAAFMADLAREFSGPSERKWEFWADGRRRSKTICVQLWPDSGDVSVAHRAVASSGCMSELNSISFEIKHLPKLIHALQRAVAVAQGCGLIKESKK